MYFQFDVWKAIETATVNNQHVVSTSKHGHQVVFSGKHEQRYRRRTSNGLPSMIDGNPNQRTSFRMIIIEHDLK